MIELDFNPFGNDGGFSKNYLQTKYRFSHRAGLKLGLQILHKKNTMTEDDYATDELFQPSFSEKYTLIGIKPGLEFRVLDNSRISPYWGFEFLHCNKSSGSEYIKYNSH